MSSTKRSTSSLSCLTSAHRSNARIVLQPRRGYIQQPRVSAAPPWVDRQPKDRTLKGFYNGRARRDKTGNVEPLLGSDSTRSETQGGAALRASLPWAVGYNPFRVRARSSNKEIQNMVITWEDALAARAQERRSQGAQEGRSQGAQEGRGFVAETPAQASLRESPGLDRSTV